MPKLAWTAAAGCIVVLAATQSACAETLGDAIALAYESNPTLQGQRAQLRATDEEYVQAHAGYRPTASATADYTYDNNQAGVLGPTVSNTTAGAITVTQPLYTGGRVAAQVDAAKADILAGREALRRTEIDVLQSVIGAYVDVRRDQEQLAISQDNVNTLQQQLDETNARFQAGQLTRTDQAQSEARLALAKSQLAAAQATLAEGRAVYATVVGRNPGDLAPEPPIASLLPATVDAAFDAAERDNPQLRQATYVEQSRAAKLAAAKAQTRPTVGVTGSYGYNGGSQSIAGQFAGFGSGGGAFSNYERNVTISASVTQPLFTGGLYASQIRQAAEEDNVARIGVESARRQVLQAVSQAWNQLLGARASLEADVQQVKSNTVAFEGVREEQKVGLRTILDVLNAQQELETSQLTLVDARHDEYVAAAAVLAAIGALEAKAIAPAEPQYDPTANFREVEHAPGWVPWEGAVDAIDHVGAPAPTPAPPPSPPGELVKTQAQ
ncbi:MAG TPA: TolC family outer membrane protein [Caulobacteraceae bacterium]|nr:TolC family outer membrane protein [Caulobacteraceae bacterium]